MIFSKILEVRGTKMKKIQKNAVRFDNLKQDFLDDKKYSGTAEATLNGCRYDMEQRPAGKDPGGALWFL